MIAVKLILMVLVGYLFGSIPFGVVISRFRTKVDLRTVGSGKIGMTNVLRTAGKKAAALVLLLDISKGALAVVVAGLIFRDDFLAMSAGEISLTPGAQVLAALAALAGHAWPVFFRFHGGRGVATFFGGLAVLYFPAALFGTIVLIISAFLTRYMSVGSLSGAVGSCVFLIVFTLMQGVPVEYLVYTLTGTAFITIMHRDNIARLLTGKERKLGEKADLGQARPPEGTQ